MPEPIGRTELAMRQVKGAELDPRQLRTSTRVESPSHEGGSFSEVLNQTIGEVQRLQTEADDTIRQLVAGEIKDVTDAMIAVEKADVAFQTLMGVRNKIVAAYEEVMRTQI
jgi:flagellar hook-basal body complex protein FliE